MDRKLITTFIVIYGLAAGAGFVFGETDIVNVPSVDVEKTEPETVRGESREIVAPALRLDDGEASEIVQLPMIIVRPDAPDEEAVEES